MTVTVDLLIPYRGILAVGDVVFYMADLLSFATHPLVVFTRLFSRFWEVVTQDSSKLIETFVASFCFGVGLWMCRFVVERQWDQVLAAILPTWMVGLTFCVIGAAIIAGLHFDMLNLRRWGQFAAACMWAVLFVFFGLLFPYLLIVSLSPTIVAMAGRSWWVLGQAGFSDGTSTRSH